MNRDTLMLICSRADDRTLALLAQTPLWDEVRLVVQSQHFWYLRTQHLVASSARWKPHSGELLLRPGDWKKAYYILEKSSLQRNYGWYGFTDSQLEDTLVLSVLIELGIDPSAYNNEAIKKASELGYTDSVRVLMSDPRVRPEAQDNKALRMACRNGHVKIVRLLLADARVDPSTPQQRPITEAVQGGHVEIVRLLLADPRVDPSVGGNWLISSASGGGDAETVRLLLADPRVDPSANDNEAIRKACSWRIRSLPEAYDDTIRLLLADPRVDPSANDNEAIKNAARQGYSSTIRLLLADPRVDPCANDNEALELAKDNLYLPSRQDEAREIIRLLSLRCT